MASNDKTRPSARAKRRPGTDIRPAHPKVRPSRPRPTKAEETRKQIERECEQPERWDGLY
jgi:hypothetical protein